MDHIISMISEYLEEIKEKNKRIAELELLVAQLQNKLTVKETSLST